MSRRVNRQVLVLFLVLWGAFPLLFARAAALPFQEGERLRFQLQWFGLPAGVAELQATKTVWEGNVVYHLVATAESSQFFSLFYKVEDRMVSYLDSRRLIPLYFSLQQHEGRYRSYREVIFDHQKQRVLYQKNQQPSREIVVPTGVHDSLSGLYYLRTLPLAVGQSTLLTLFLNGKVQPVEVRVVRSESLETQWGMIETLVVQPLLTEAEEIFREKRDFFIWLSNDQRRIPLRVSLRIPLGLLEGTLIDM